tara:strand:- start:761 stop:994 length:234 start_codon:yes stop_codon:yes gene_type:complete
MVPEGFAITSGALVGEAVAAGADAPPPEGIAVGAAAALVGTGAAAIGVAVADEPHAKMAASMRARGPRIINLGFLNQ